MDYVYIPQFFCVIVIFIFIFNLFFVFMNGHFF